MVSGKNYHWWRCFDCQDHWIFVKIDSEEALQQKLEHDCECPNPSPYFTYDHSPDWCGCKAYTIEDGIW